MAWAAIFLLSTFIGACNAQIDVSVGGVDTTKGKWYIWLIVGIAGATLIYVAFFVVRGCLVARRRRDAFRAGGVNEEDSIYTDKHAAVWAKLLPRSKMPQGKGSTSFSPMVASMQTWNIEDKKTSGKGIDEMSAV